MHSMSRTLAKNAPYKKNKYLLITGPGSLATVFIKLIITNDLCSQDVVYQPLSKF